MQDLSHRFETDMPTFPGDPGVQVSPVKTIEQDGYRVTGFEGTSHAGTHIDAPSHTEPEGKPLADLPVERFVFDAVRVDCRDLNAREPIPPERVPETEADCVVFQTGWDEFWGTDHYLDHPYLAPETARRCAARNLAVGTDTLNPDPSPSPNRDQAEPEGYQAHHALLGSGLLIIENLTNLESVPERFELHAQPLPLGTDGAPVRAVAVQRE
ncbi:cyclase family protein [Halodesulfurarchaeum sp. HSR-GB]|uniref:cyclase family protein n=1 Tax=Halodesulfurarchaeum sp. HSR-GB TaxID=3074077 RepID=UPI0028562ED4|nr:cyclase family protein [Halodesulfurarchaeum sp. HSR-GB]MDR5657527.1 cyclase family protein [Halodesulfurarchaeum sp. HSR-GB]